MKINQKFADHVTSVSFSLQLSRPMVAMLVMIGEEHIPNFRAIGVRSIEVPTMRRLEERGLVEAPDPSLPGRLVLTEAGEHVLALLRISGLVVENKA